VREQPKPAGGRPQGSVQVHSASRARSQAKALQVGRCSQTFTTAGGSNRRPISLPEKLAKGDPSNIAWNPGLALALLSHERGQDPGRPKNLPLKPGNGFP